MYNGYLFLFYIRDLILHGCWFFSVRSMKKKKQKSIELREQYLQAWMEIITIKKTGEKKCETTKPLRIYQQLQEKITCEKTFKIMFVRTRKRIKKEFLYVLCGAYSWISKYLLLKQKKLRRLSAYEWWIAGVLWNCFFYEFIYLLIISSVIAAVFVFFHHHDF